jgi:hypothetical protein
LYKNCFFRAFMVLHLQTIEMPHKYLVAS